MMLYFIEFHFQQDHKHSNTCTWNTCTLLYIYSPIWVYHLLARAMCFERNTLCFTHCCFCGYPTQAMSDSSGCSTVRDILLYRNKITFTFCCRKTQHIYLTTSWDLFPNLPFKKWMGILQLHTQINMFCTGIFLNTKDCEGLFSVHMVHITLDWIWNGNTFKVLEVKDLQ
jgi:hypothetical protein